MLQHQHLELEKRKAVPIHIDGPSQTRIDRILVHGQGKTVYLRGDADVTEKTEVKDLGYPITSSSEPYIGGEYGTSQGIYLVSDTPGVHVDVLVVGNA